MSWSAERYGKRQRLSHDRYSLTGSVCRGRKTTLQRTDDQQMVTRLAMEMNEVIVGGALESIFGSSSAAYALSVALRIKRAKGRDATLLSSEDCARSGKSKARRHLCGRNIHHMTPKSRKGQLFSGEAIHNLLLLKVPRHDILHKEFGIRTWEEIIVLLARCINIAWRADFAKMVDAVVPAPARNRMCRRMVRRSLRNIQLFGEGPDRSGLFILSSEEQNENLFSFLTSAGKTKFLFYC
jgi:hypothetical protein